MDLAAILARYRATGLLPSVSGGDGESGATGPTGPMQHGSGGTGNQSEGATGATGPTGATGSDFSPITSQAEFDRRLHARLQRKEEEVKTSLRAELVTQVTEELQRKADEERLKEEGKFKEIAERYEQQTVPSLEAKVKDLETKLTETSARLEEIDQEREKAYKEAFDKLPEQLQKLAPKGASLADREVWLADAVAMTGGEDVARLIGLRSRDPLPADFGKLAPELVEQELRSTGSYRSPM